MICKSMKASRSRAHRTFYFETIQPMRVPRRVIRYPDQIVLKNALLEAQELAIKAALHLQLRETGVSPFDLFCFGGEGQLGDKA